MDADQTRVRQVLLNVLGNAAKFTEQGSVVLRVSLDEVPDMATPPGGALRPVVLFEISDTGIGMSQEHQRKLFREFMQVDDASTRKYGGSGLGLAISRRLCTLMGGEISVTSTLGQGSTFTVQLPLHGAQAGAVSAETTATHAP